MCVDTEPSWVDPLLLYLKDGKLPKGDAEAQEIKRKARRFVIVERELYKRSFSQPLLNCILHRESDYILREIHEGICGSHIGARTLCKKTLRQGYYWPTMMGDSKKLVRACERCQRTSNLVHLPAVALTHSVTSCPVA